MTLLNVEHFEKFESYVPVDLTNGANFLIATGLIFGIVVFRYFLMAGLFWIVFYKARFQGLKKRQIYKELPDRKMMLFEIKWSFISAIIFALGGSLLGFLWQKGWTQIYLKIEERGLGYFIVSLFLMSLLHEVYFYWTHRWLHQPKVFQRYHAVHHRSLTPSPWASFSFHPVEAVIQALAIPIIVLVLPVHPLVLLVYLTIMTLSAVTNHLGFEILPSGSEKGLGRFFISGVHHTMHHKYFKSNFGLFYTFCDHLFKTENPKFAEEYKKVFEKKSS